MVSCIKAWKHMLHLHDLHKLSLSVKIKEDSYNIVKTILIVIIYDYLLCSRHYTKCVTYFNGYNRPWYWMSLILDEETQRGEKTCQSLHGKWRARNSSQVCLTPNLFTINDEAFLWGDVCFLVYLFCCLY